VRRQRALIVGGGLVGLRSAEALRQGGFDGSIDLVCAETELPYDRPPLSKAVLTGEREPTSTVFRGLSSFADLDIRLHRGIPASSLDLTSRTVTVDDDQLPFDDLIIGTGSSPRTLGDLPALEGVHVLRGIDDAATIRGSLLREPRVVVLGAGVLGAEVASSARHLGLEVTILEQQDTPMLRSVGARMGSVLAALHDDHGTRLLCGVSVEAVEGSTRVERIRLSNGETVECDLLVLGIGSRPNTSWLEDSGLTISDGVVCDRSLRAGPEGVYAAGDVARWPNPLVGRMQRCEQWMTGVEQARYVASCILGKPRSAAFLGSNYSWSHQYGAHLQFVGTTYADDFEVVSGSTTDREFVVHYRRAGRLVGAMAMNRPTELMAAKREIEISVGGLDVSLGSQVVSDDLSACF
jgi:NADPH-dependent 2,4-dienoyl-CoA reductase/sulfur reductase-like enzyme